MNYYNATLRAAIAAAIHTPADPPITGAELQAQLLSMVDGFGAGALFMGTATPATIPTTEANCFFLATTEGTYTNFLDTGGNAIALAACEAALIRSTIFDDSLRWQKLTIVEGVSLEPVTTTPEINPGSTEGTEYVTISNASVSSNIVQYYDYNTTTQIILRYEITGGKDYYLSGWWKISTKYTVASWTDENGSILKIEPFRGDDDLGLTLVNKKIIAPSGARYLYLLNRVKNYHTNPTLKVVAEDGGQKRQVRLLVIGNSYSQDALGYLPFLLPKVTDNIDLTLGILYVDGGSLEDHWNNWQRNSETYDFYISQYGNAWVRKTEKSIKYALDEYSWDVIVTHQKSSSAYVLSTYQPYLNNLLGAIQDYISYPVKFGWMIVQSRPGSTATNTPNFSVQEIEDHFASIVTNSEKVLDDTLCEFAIPWGTAIQNARTIDSIATLGDYSGSDYNNLGKGYLTYDGVHLQEGLPCEIASYTCLLTLLSLIGEEYHSILGDDTEPDSIWLSGKGIPGKNGQPVGVTLNNARIAQKCAVMAVKNPSKVTDMAGLVPNVSEP